jgi:hypothetical protein
MTSTNLHDQCTCTVDISPEDVDAGAELTVECRIDCPEGCDLEGLQLAVRDPDGTEVATAGIAAFEDDEAGDGAIFYATDPIPLVAPRAAGTHMFSVELLPAERNGVRHEMTTEFPVTVKAHTARLNVWDVPSAVVAGESFTFNIGLKCSSDCDLTGRNVEVVDHDGNEVASGRVGGIWPGTAALHFLEVTVLAPSVPGEYDWQVRVPESDAADLPHAAGALTFHVRSVKPADFEVTIEAVDGTSKAPLPGANIVMHPYRTVTDATGTARIRVARGEYRILVSRSKYIPMQTMVDVTRNIATRAELTLEPPPRPPEE